LEKQEQSPPSIIKNPLKSPFEASKFVSRSYIEEMVEFDEIVLEKNADGLNRKYKECPNYDNEKTRSIILSYLTPLKRKKHPNS